jgi:hypothetical protein
MDRCVQQKNILLHYLMSMCKPVEKIALRKKYNHHHITVWDGHYTDLPQQPTVGKISII